MKRDEMLAFATGDGPMESRVYVLPEGRKPRNSSQHRFVLFGGGEYKQVATLSMQTNATERDGFTDKDLLEILRYRIDCLDPDMQSPKLQKIRAGITNALTALRS